MIERWRSDPKTRFYVRTFVVAAVTYVVSSFSQGGQFTDWHSFVWGAVGAGCTALIGVLTPVEPFVGVRPSSVDVPTPPARGGNAKP